jgi:hypothetical protein
MSPALPGPSLLDGRLWACIAVLAALLNALVGVDY